MTADIAQPTFRPAARQAPQPAQVRNPALAIDSVVRLLSLSTLWLSLLLVTSWWVGAGGVQDLTGWASGLTSVGRYTGLVSSVLLLAQVVAMVRVPAVERAFGQDRLARIHRILGFTSFVLMVVHVVTITWGYAGGSAPQLPGMLWQLTLTYPGMLLAAAGTGCLVLVVVTSVRAARRRLRYESWHLLHLYAYLGVGLALPHQLWTGTEFTSSPGRTIFWWTAWAATAALVVLTRVLPPVVLNLRHQLRVTSVVPEAPGIWSVYVTGRRLDAFPVSAGQFLTWRFLDGPGWTRGNPYSLSAAPDGRSLRTTVASVGDGSARIQRLRPGTRVLVEGPYGRLTQRARSRTKVAFIGAGVGVTPLRALAEELPYRPGEAVYLERSTRTPLFWRELDQLSAERGLGVLRLIGPRRHPDSWLPAQAGHLSDRLALLAWIPDLAERDIYLCGPTGWVDRVCATLRSAGVPTEQLHIETFSW